MDFQTRVKSIFDRCKRKLPTDPLMSIPVQDEKGRVIATLVPITKDFRTSMPHLPEILTRWRNENPTISTGKFVAEPERTARWLDNLVIGRDDRLIFMIHAPDETPLGHIGFSNFDYEAETGEVDSVLKGVKDGYPGLMSHASRALIAWGLREVGMKDVTLSVYSDNDSAIRFYEKLGFVKSHTKPLYKVMMGDEEKLEIAPPGYTGPVEKYYLYMRLEKKDA